MEEEVPRMELRPSSKVVLHLVAAAGLTAEKKKKKTIRASPKIMFCSKYLKLILLVSVWSQSFAKPVNPCEGLVKLT